MADRPDVIDRYLPPEFSSRLPHGERAWRGRVVLLLWALGYPLEMAWVIGLADVAGQGAFYRSVMAGLDDERLAADLEATAEVRGDGSDLGFGWLGPIEVLVRV